MTAKSCIFSMAYPTSYCYFHSHIKFSWIKQNEAANNMTAS